MPNRIIKESIGTSEKIASLSDFEFRVWISLIVSADDAGRGDARPAVIRGRCFPLRERVTVKDVDAAVHGLAAKGCVSLYTVGGKPYFWFPTWSQHQRVRDCKPKFPSPEEADGLRESAETVGDFSQSDATCGNSPQTAAECGFNPIQSGSESESNPNPNFCVEPEAASTPPPVISLPLNDGTEYPVSQEQCQKWAGLYPAVDVIQQLRNMVGWLDSNPSRRKTKAGISRFITGWLSREQDRGKQGKSMPGPASRAKTWLEIGEELEREEGLS